MNARIDIPGPGPASNDGSGLGPRTCAFCDGLGRWRPPADLPPEPCLACDGDGARPICPQCNGLGWDLTPLGSRRTCGLCQGTGWLSRLLAEAYRRHGVVAMDRQPAPDDGAGIVTINVSRPAARGWLNQIEDTMTQIEILHSRDPHYPTVEGFFEEYGHMREVMDALALALGDAGSADKNGMSR